jgi:hypothetical protein
MNVELPVHECQNCKMIWQDDGPPIVFCITCSEFFA